MTKNVFCLVGLMGVSAACASDMHPAAEIARAEIGFARMSVESGMHSAFAHNFASDAVDFAPRPRTTGQQWYARTPNPPIKLDWYPAFTLSASSGDFGLSTGPWQVSDHSGKREPAYGHYFSIWRKRDDGTWKVAFDAGISHPQTWDAIPRLQPQTMPPNILPATESDTTLQHLYDADADFSRRATAQGVIGACKRVCSDEVRFYRDGALPAVGKPNALEALKSIDGAWSWTPEGGGIANSGNLGYTYGISTSGAQSGAFLHVWQLVDSEWRLLALLEKPLKAE